MLTFLLELLENAEQREFVADLYEKLGMDFYRYAFSLSRDQMWAEDAVSTVFTKIIDRFDKYEKFDYGETSRYFITAIRNLFLKEKKAQTLFYEGDMDISDIPSVPALEEDALQQLTIAEIKEGVKSLSEIQQAIIHLFYDMNYKHHQIADELGITEKNSSVMLSRAIALLRRQMAVVK